ncbi:MAG TPA: family 1 glycosylhydrolase [Blastocatellia bacterium]|jgi:dTDP-4-dehydrorhamnose reductase
MNLSKTQPELWAGVECSTIRVKDDYYHQLGCNGHAGRIEDLELFAGLGIRAMRYPVLWERVAPSGLDDPDWSWPDERLGRLSELSINPIVGLLHHGSGPRYTSLIDPEFPEKLASFARAVAERYPWVGSYTPVNEPLTTARFSGLYGHWYPHGRDDKTFLRALLLQCKGVALSMRAIREINPAAQLIQTEDLGRCFSTRKLSYQASFENERRWLTFDLLSARVDQDHPMWSYLRWIGIDEGEMMWFLDNPCAPDVVGINHYLTSERFLDERLDRYPASTHGGNGRHKYADVEAVRVLPEGMADVRVILEEAWDRYGLPFAVTEAHLGCTREEQLRWINEVWTAACELKHAGADMRAVTIWSLLGSYDWNTLLTCPNGFYEPGAFDLRGPRPRPTAIARMAKDLATKGEHSHPLLEAPGWWRRLDRLHYRPHNERPYVFSSEGTSRDMRRGTTRPLVITGATGTLGYAFARICHVRGIPYRLLTRKEMDIADAQSVEAALCEMDPWAVVNAAGYVRVDQAEQEAESCYRENACGPATLAAACARRGAALLTFSSDLVFDGSKKEPYVESDRPAPLNVYGKSKAAAEQAALAALPSALVIRTSAFFGPWDEYNFVSLALRSILEGRRFPAAGDAVVSPTYVPDLVNASLDLLIDGENGIWHLSNIGQLSWAELAELAASIHGLNPTLVESRPAESFNFAAPRPLYSVLGSERGQLLPKLENALARYSRERWSADVRLKNALYAGAGLKATVAKNH